MEQTRETSWFQISLIVLGVAIYIPGRIFEQKQTDFRYEVDVLQFARWSVHFWLCRFDGNLLKVLGTISKLKCQKRSKTDTLISALFIIFILLLFGRSVYEINNCFYLRASFRFYPSSFGFASRFSKTGTLPNGLKYVISNQP